LIPLNFLEQRKEIEEVVQMNAQQNKTRYKLWLYEDGVKKCIGTFDKEIDAEAKAFRYQLIIDDDQELCIEKIEDGEDSSFPRFTDRNGTLYIDGKKVIKGFESWSGWFWFALEVSHTQDSVIRGKNYKNDTIWFGFVQGMVDEYGYFSEKELQSLYPKIWEIPAKALPYAGRRGG
jgi:hypothetical protein